jgi:hypothetical protein
MGYLAKIPEELAAVAELRRDQDTIDTMLWGSVERKQQYEGGTVPKTELPVGTNFAVEPTRENPLGTQLENPQATNAKLAQAQATLRAAAQAASEALVAKQEATLVPEPAKKTTNPSPYKDVGAILKGMGLPG